MQLRPDEIAPRLRYNLLIGAIVPRPIAVVGTQSADGRLNLAPFSFFNALSSDPMMLGFCPGNDGDGNEKDTLKNCKPTWEGGTGVFTISLATESTIKRVVAAAEDLPYGESEFDLTKLTPLLGVSVRAPRVAESPIAFECETFQVLRFGPNKPGAGTLVIGRVIMIHIADEFRHDRMHVDPAKLLAVGRMGGTDYTRTRDRFELPMGREALVTEIPT
ncbi:MAG: flavin reductase family protein [Phycisphaerae bacterium]|nr:flavin reductase family protein [Phycisphaerae bacterium]